jgi:hypothetical protein
MVVEVRRARWSQRGWLSVVGRATVATDGLDMLTRPGFLTALILLLANDLYLKAHATSWLTGKLSDFAGLFVFAAFWTAVAPRHRRAIHFATAGAFLLWKSPWSEPLITLWNVYGPWDVQRVVDYTDWVALLTLPISYRYTRAAPAAVDSTGTSLGWLLTRVAVSGVCLAAMVATSYDRPLHPVGWKEDAEVHSRSAGPLRLTLKHLYTGSSDTRLSPTLVIRNTGRDTAVLRRAQLITPGRSRVAKLRLGSPVAHVVVAPGGADSVGLSWILVDSATSSYDPLRMPATIRFVFEVGSSIQLVDAMLDTDERRAHPTRYRVRVARYGLAIFLAGILVALTLRRRRRGAIAAPVPPPRPNEPHVGMQVDSLGFSLSYDARVVEFSGAGARADREFVSSAEPKEPHERGPWLHVRVEAHGAPAWTAAFELDAPGYYLTGVYGLPSGEDILVVAAGEGYVVSVRDPDVWHWAPLAPVVGVRRVDGSPLVVLWDFQDLAVYGAEGGLWRRERFATDELEVTGASGDVIEGELWRGEFPSGARRPFRIEASTGRLLEGDEYGQLRTRAEFLDR